MVTKEQILSLIESLHPRKTEFELIRLGSNHDGGYLVPDILDGIVACFSPGVSNMSQFELDCIERNIRVFMADKSVESPNLNVPKRQYSFIKKFIGCVTNDEYITMDDWVESSGLPVESELLLQMDIEWGEYISFINMSQSLLKRFRVMVIEFHGLPQLWNPTFFRFAQPVFNKILDTHICVHIHPNNGGGIVSKFEVDIPRFVEITFLRKDYVETIEFVNDFPHKLDRDNTQNESITLPRIWYKNDLVS